MKISGKIKRYKSSNLSQILEELQIANGYEQLLVFKGTEKEAIVNLKDGTYTMRPFGTILLELINKCFKVAEAIGYAFDTDTAKSNNYDDYVLSFVEAFEKRIKALNKIENPNSDVNEELKKTSISNYLSGVQNFIDIFTNKKDLTLIHIPHCITLKASEFVIPFSKNIQKNSYLDFYCYSSLNDILSVYTKLFYENKIPFKQCKNCFKYFIPIHKSNETLCNNIYKNGKTCKQLSGEIKLSKDEVLSIYRTAYKRENGKKNRYRHIPNIQLKFENWNKIAKEKYTDCQRGAISKEEFSDWLNSSRDWYKD